MSEYGARFRNAQRAQLLGQLVAAWPKIRRMFIGIGIVIGILLAVLAFAAGRLAGQ